MALTESPSSREARRVGAPVKILCSAYQATVATGTIGGMLIDRACKLRGLRAKVGVCGSSGTTTVQIHKNGTLVTGATLDFANTLPDPTVLAAGVDVDLVADDQIKIIVTAAATGATDLAVDCLIFENV